MAVTPRGSRARSETAAPAERPWLPFALGLALVALVLVAYEPALHAGYIWDDDGYLTKNELLRDGAGLARLWIPGQTPQYYPIVFTTFWLEHHLWGLEPAGYHLVNLLLHALNAVLVWRLARALRIPGSWFIAAVFALHPVHVESVAWITERKNVLSGAFYLLAALCYLRFDAQAELPASGSSGDRRRLLWYGAAFALFVLALLSKTVTCSLPAALILMRLWQRKPFGLRRLAPLVPMFVVGLLLALHTAYLERTQVGASGTDFEFTLAERVLIASKALLFYPTKLLWPWPLVFLYPRWQLDASDVTAYGPTAVVLLVAGLALYLFARGRRAPALALAFFAGSLFPALGFFNVYPMRYSFVADHFQYLASLGIIALLVGAAVRLAPRHLLPACGAVVLACLGTLTWRQSQIYADTETLWRETIRRNPGSWMARTNLAALLSERGENAQALECLEQAQGLTTSAKALQRIRLDRALTLGKLGRHEEALREYQELQRSVGGMELRLARTLERLGRDDEAETLFRQALAGARADDALIPFGVHLLRRGRPEEAVIWLERFVAAHPDDADALMFLADACAGAGRLEDAIAAGERALQSSRSQGNLGKAELVRKRLEQYRSSRG